MQEIYYRNKPKPSGKLYSKYRNCINRLKKVPKHRKVASISKTKPTPTVKNIWDESSKLWLRYNFEPWQTIETKWKETFQQRQEELSLGCSKNLAEYYIEWPVLKTCNGFSLVIAHFFIPIEFLKTHHY